MVVDCGRPGENRVRAEICRLAPVTLHASSLGKAATARFAARTSRMQRASGNERVGGRPQRGCRISSVEAEAYEEVANSGGLTFASQAQTERPGPPESYRGPAARIH